MSRSRIVHLACVAATLAGCAAPHRAAVPPPTDYVPIDRLEISSQFPTVELTRETLAAAINQCVPQVKVDSSGSRSALSQFPSNNVVLIGHLSSANQFWVNKTTGFCLRTSSAKFPILAGEAFIETVNPKGVPPDVTDGWYRQIALRMASRGSAKVAYVFENGNAFVVDYWMESNRGATLRYSSALRKAGTWETETIDFRFTHPALSAVSETKRGNEWAKPNLLAHRRA
jgi:hypothetical protein